jgi:hypothetical protein
MANTVTSQILIDGDRNLVMLFTGLLDTSNESRVIKVDVSGLVPAPTKVRVDRIEYAISGGLIVILDWDASTPVRFAALSGQGEVEACKFGGLQNSAGAGVTGDIFLTTAGYTSGIVAYNVLIEMVKGSF